MDFFNNYKGRFQEYLDGRDLRTIVREKYQEAIIWMQEMKNKLQHLRQTNYDLGMWHYNNGNLQDAILRFKMLRRFSKIGMPELDYLLGRCYLERNQKTKAIQWLEQYIRSGDDRYRSEADYCLKVAQGHSEQIKQIPLSIVDRLFNLLAEKYDSIFLQAPDLPQDEVYKIIVSHFAATGHPYGNRILDLGCGTGYIAKMLKNSKIAFAIEGVDISSKMITMCKELKIEGMPCYDNLFHTDIDTFLQGDHSGKFDVVITSYLLGFYSNAELFCKLVSDALKKKGVVVLTFKTTTTNEDMVFDTFLEEFSFNSQKLAKLFQDNGLQIKYAKEVVFPDKDPGLVWLLMKE